MRKWKKILAAGAAVIVTAASVSACSFQDILSNNNNSSSSSAAEEESSPSYTGHTTIAFYGVDSRNSKDKGRSDVIMLLSIDNDSQDIKVVSVYRDTFLNVTPDKDTVNFEKANAAYAYGGVEGANSMLEKSLDLTIDNYATCDFGTIAKTIDILGGVPINISSKEELGYLNKYISNTNKILHTKSKHISSTGKHTLDGVQAVAYTRIRYTAGGDYKRAQRQRTVFSQIAKKAKSAHFTTLIKLMNQVYPNINTNLKKSEMLSMVKAMRGYSTNDMRGFPFKRAAVTLGSKGSVVVPCDLSTNVKQLHKFLYGADTAYTVSDTVKEYSQHIINETGLTCSSAESDAFDSKDSASGKSANKTPSAKTSSTEKKAAS
jgi:LCP family protein required for cell wall assembly